VVVAPVVVVGVLDIVVVVLAIVVVEVDPPEARAMTGAMGALVGTTVVMPEVGTELLG